MASWVSFIYSEKLVESVALTSKVRQILVRGLVISNPRPVRIEGAAEAAAALKIIARLKRDC